MKILLLFLLLIWCRTVMNTQTCSRPAVARKQAFIYRTFSTINVKVLRCLYNDSTIAYSDISNNCMSAFTTGMFTNKYNDTYNIKRRYSPILLEEYITKADLLKNQISLRSGTKCRYDRGFCYDPTETLSYAAVWYVVPVPKEKCPNKVEQLFTGFVDLWTFTPNNLTYLFYYNQHYDKSFALRLTDRSICHNKEVWYTDEQGYIVSFASLSHLYSSLKKPNQQYFSIKSKRFVSEAILKDCDLKTNALDFDKEIDADYLIDPENLRAVLKLYFENINNDKKAIVALNTHVVKIIGFLKNNITKQTASPNVEFENSVVPIETLFSRVFSKDKETEELLKERKRKEDELYLRILNTEKNNVDLKNIVNSLQANYKNSDAALQNIKSDGERKIDSLNSTLDKKIIQKLVPLFDIVNKSRSSCLDAIKNLKQDAEKTILNMKDEIFKHFTLTIQNAEKHLNDIKASALRKMDSTDSKVRALQTELTRLKDAKDEDKRHDQELATIKKNVTSTLKDLYSKFSSIEITVNEKLTPGLNAVNIQSKKYLEQTEILRTSLKNSLNAFEEEIQKNTLDLNNSLTHRISSSAKSIQDLTDILNVYKRDSDNSKSITQLKLNDIIQNITKTNELTSTDVEDIISKKVNPQLNTLNDKSTTCLNYIDTLKKDVEKFVEHVKQELMKNNIKVADVSKEFSKADKTIIDKVDQVNLKITDFEKKTLQQFNVNVDANKKATAAYFERIKQVELLENENISNVRKELSKQVNLLMQFANGKSESCMNKIENIKKDIDESLNELKKNVNENVISETIQYKKDADNLKSSLSEKINVCGARVNSLERISNDILNNLPNTIETRILEKMDLTLTPIITKITDGDDETNKFKELVEKTIADLKIDILRNVSVEDKRLAEELRKGDITLSSKIEATNEKLHNLEGDIKGHNVKIDDIKIHLNSVTKDVNLTNTILSNTQNVVSNIEKQVDDLSKTIKSVESNTVNNALRQFTFFNQSLEKNSDTFQILQNELKITNSKINESTIHSITFDHKLRELSTSTEHIEQNVKLLQEETKNFNKLNADINTLKNDVNLNKELLKGNENTIETLHESVTSCNAQQIASDEEIKELKTVLEKTKDVFEKKEELFTDSLMKFQKLLDKKNDEISEIRAELLRLSSCCTENKAILLDRGNEIQQLKDEFMKNRETVVKQIETVNVTLNHIISDYGVVPDIV